MALQTKLQWDPDVLEPVFKEIYTTASKGKKDFIPLMYRQENSTKDTESYEGVGAEPLMEEWQYSNNQVNYSEVEELWKKRIKNRKFSDGRQIDRDFVDDLRLGEIRRRIISMANGEYKTKQLQAVEFLNNAFSLTGPNWRGRNENYGGPDGKALCAVDHPYSPTNTADVQSNKGTEELSIDSWDETAVAMQEWVDSNGDPMGLIPDTLIVHPYNARRAFQIAGLPDREVPPYEPGTANFDLNMYQGDIKVIVNPFLKAANRKNWFAADSMRMHELNVWQWRRRPGTGSITDFDTEVLKYKNVGRWAFGFINYSFIFGHEATT